VRVDTVFFVVYGIYMLHVWEEPIEFQWDAGNEQKNEKHGVVNREMEEAFFDKKKAIAPDPRHSQAEQRYILLGRTEKKRLLYIVFTVRTGRVRVISARDINKKEVKLYEEAT
jgi:uncharacterized DUF497 family protein